MPVADHRDFNFPVSTIVGSSLPNFLKLSRNKRVDRKYLKRYLLTMVFSGILDPFGRIENIFNRHRILSSQPDQPPIFIIGFWRSGTTFLHNLLCRDPEFVFVSTFQSIFPNHVLWNKWWLERIIRVLMPDYRPVDKVKLNLNFPQEEEISMGNAQLLSFYHFFYFPDHFDEFMKKALYFVNVTEDELEVWSKAYKMLIGKAAIKTNGNIFLSKSPSNTFRIKKILELYPDARFIYLYRNPYMVLTSYRLFMSEVISGIGFQELNRQQHLENVCKLYENMLNSYEENRRHIPQGNLIEVRYENFKENPLQTVENIYCSLGLPDFENKRQGFENYIHDNRKHTSGHYEIDPEIRKFVTTKLVDFLEEKGYPFME